MSITTSKFGDSPATLIKITNSAGSVLTLTDLGATIVGIEVPSRTGDLIDVSLGYNSYDYYMDDDKYFGATVGRFANRIAGAALVIDGAEYRLDKNQGGKHTLHGGSDGWHQRVWDWEYGTDDSGDTVTFSLHSPDMDQGFPGAADIKVSFELTDDNTVRISYHAVSDRETVFNLTNHAYFNLSGEGAGSILEHNVRINASRITVVDADSIPTGELLDITGTALDFTGEKKIGRDIEADNEQIAFAQGYDHNYIIDGAFENGTVSRKLRDVAEASSDTTGIVMTVRTDMSGIQLYTGNYLGEGHPTKSGSVPARRSAFCLETQFFPDAPNHKNFTSAFFKAGEAFESVTEYTFSVSA